MSLFLPKSHRGRIMLALAALFVAAIGFRIAQRADAPDEAKRRRADVVTVALAIVAKGDIDIVRPALGTVTPLADVTVRTQISGQLLEVAFHEGQMVNKGDFLAQVDPRPYEAALEQAKGQLQKDMALLKDAQVNLARFQKLAQQNSISKQQLDTQASLVQQYEGNVAVDKGQIDAANLNLAYCHITSPLSGRAGLRQVDPGNYVQTSDANGIVTITQLDPISVLFVLPEDQLPAVMKRLREGAELQVTAFDRAGEAKLATGKLTAVDNAIDTSTGTIKLRAQFDNADHALFPNQFVNIQIKVDTLQAAVLAPQSALLRGSVGAFVYLAKEDGTVAMRPVKTGIAQSDKIEIIEGLNEGDKVVTEGTDKLRDGAKYKVPGPAPEQSPPQQSEQGSVTVKPSAAKEQ